MSELKELNNRLDYVEARRLKAVEEADAQRRKNAAAQAEAAHYRTEARRLHAQITSAAEGLAQLLARTVAESELNPGDRGLAGRVRASRAAVEVFTAAVSLPEEPELVPVLVPCETCKDRANADPS
jgi:hypothetical protein